MLSLLLLVSPVLGIIKIPINSIQTFSDSSSIRSPPIQGPQTSLYVDSSTQTLNNFENTQYIAKLQLGTPPRSFNLLIDTSTSYLWIPDSACSSCTQRNKFDTSSSSTFYYSGTHTSIDERYFVSGMVGVDTVYIGDPLIYVTDQPLLDVDNQSRFDATHADGVLGLGFKKSSSSFYPLIQTMKRQEIIDHAIFSIYFSNFEDSADYQSVLILGGYDPYPYSSDSIINWLDVEETGYWEVKLHDVKYSGNSKSSTTTAFFDLGAPWIYAPQDSFDSIYYDITSHHNHNCDQKHGVIHCSCNSVHEFESMKFYMDGFVFKLDSEDLFLHKNGECVFQVVAWEKKNWSLGATFLRKFYTIYDMDTLEIGIAGYADKYENDDDDVESAVRKTIGIILGVFYGMNLVIGITVICIAYKRRRYVGDQVTTRKIVEYSLNSLNT